jgi:hypothetical protein
MASSVSHNKGRKKAKSLASQVTASKRVKPGQDPDGEDPDEVPPIVPLGWTQEILSYESALSIDAIRKEIHNLSPEKKPSPDQQITVYWYYSLPDGKQNKEWRDLCTHGRFYDRITMFHPKALTLFPTPSKVFCNSLDGLFSMPMANTLENKEKVRIFWRLSVVFRLVQRTTVSHRVSGRWYVPQGVGVLHATLWTELQQGTGQ